MRVKGWNALVGKDSDERIVRFAAMAIALAANVFFALYMFHALRLAQEPPADDELRTSLVWITRPKAVPLPQRTAGSRRPRIVRSNAAWPLEAEQRADSKGERSLPAPTAMRTEARSLLEPNGADRNDDWHLPPQEVAAFRKRDFLTRKQERMEATVSRLTFNIHDNSLAGRLERMTKASICRDLRRALIGSPASAAAILASMDEQGCGQR